jgi:hypothetical protein
MRKPEEDTRWANAAPVGHERRRRRHWESKILRFLSTQTRGNLFLSLDGRRDLGLDGRRDLTCRGCGMEMEKGAAGEQAALQGQGWKNGIFVWMGEGFC